MAQYPVLLPGTAVTLTNAGAPHTTMVALIVWRSSPSCSSGPPSLLLFNLQGRRLLHADEAGTLAAASLAGRIRPPYAPPGRQPPAGRSPVIRAAVLAVVVLAALAGAASGVDRVSGGAGHDQHAANCPPILQPAPAAENDVEHVPETTMMAVAAMKPTWSLNPG